jgi:hypothetical protein
MDFSACTDFPEIAFRPLVTRLSPRVNKQNITFPYLENSEWMQKKLEETTRIESRVLRYEYKDLGAFYEGKGEKGMKRLENSPRRNFDYLDNSRLKVGYHHRCQTATDLEEVRLYQNFLNQRLIRKFKVIRKELLPQTKAYGTVKCESPIVGLKVRGIMKNFTTRRKVKRVTS